HKGGPIGVCRDTNGAAGWSSPVARQAHNLKVVGSNPTPATTISSQEAAPPGGFFAFGAGRVGSCFRSATGTQQRPALRRSAADRSNRQTVPRICPFAVESARSWHSL